MGLEVAFIQHARLLLSIMGVGSYVATIWQGRDTEQATDTAGKCEIAS